MRAQRALFGFSCLLLFACNLPAPVANDPTTVDGLEPPPVIGQGAFPNAPDDSRWVTVNDQEWTQAPNANTGSTADNGSHLTTWGDVNNVSLIDVPGAPWGSGAKAISVKLPAGMAGGTVASFVGQHSAAAGQVGPLAFPAALSDGALYVGFWIRNRGSDGKPYTPLGVYSQRGHGNVGQKWMYLTSSGAPDAQTPNHIIIGWTNAEAEGYLADTADVRRVFPTWAPQFPNRPGSRGCTNTRHQPTGDLANGWRDEEWHRVEYLLLPNSFESNGQPKRNGRVIIWLDGHQVLDDPATINYCSTQLGSDGSLKWTLSNVMLEPIYGGGVNPVPYDLYVDYGRTKIAYRKRSGT